jgi:hypothetical protein
MPRLSPVQLLEHREAHYAYVCARRATRTAHADAAEAARLRSVGVEVRQAAREKQEPTGVSAPMGSTAPRSVPADGRAASAQCDTGTP